MASERTNRLENPPGGWVTPGRFALVLAVALLAAFPLVALGLHSFFYRDYGVLGYPFVAYHHDSFWRGEWPLWNPYSNCGAPFLAQWGTMTLYPGSILYLLFPLPWSLSYFCLGHLLLGGVGMFFLARRWVGSSFPAGVAGVAFVFSGTTFSCLLWPNYTVALGWMPWVVLLVERSWREGGRMLVLAALVSALQLLSGVPELVLLTWLLAGCLWLDELRRGDTRRGLLVRRLAVVVCIVAGLAAVQLLPFQDLLEHSQRDRNFATTKWAMPSWGWANLLVPLFHCFQSFQGPYMQAGQEFLTSYYPGIGILVLSLVALWRAKERRVWILFGLVLFSLLMAWGDNGFLYPVIKRIIPVVGIARYPIKFVLLAAFALPLLAAFALRRLECAGPSTKHQHTLLFTGFGAVLMIGLIVWMARQHPYQSEMWSAADKARAPQLEWSAVWPNALGRTAFLVAMLGGVLLLHRTQRASVRGLCQGGLFALLVADVLTHTATQNPTLPVAAFTRGLRDAEDAPVLPRLGEGRVLISPGAESRLLYSECTDATQDYLGKRLGQWSNLNLLEGVPKVNGSSTLQVREQAEVQRLIYGTNVCGRGLLDFLAVSHFSPARNPTEWVRREGSSPLVTCGQQPVFAAAGEVLKALPAEGFEPLQSVYLDPEDRPRVTVTNRTEARVLSTTHSTHKLLVEVEAKAPSLVVVAQSFHQSWRATVDGRSVLLLRANHAFQCLEVPEGRHQISLVYRDHRFVFGGLITLGTVAGCAGYWIWSRRRALNQNGFGNGASLRSAGSNSPVESGTEKLSF